MQDSMRHIWRIWPQLPKGQRWDDLAGKSGMEQLDFYKPYESSDTRNGRLTPGTGTLAGVDMSVDPDDVSADSPAVTLVSARRDL